MFRCSVVDISAQYGLNLASCISWTVYEICHALYPYPEEKMSRTTRRIFYYCMNTRPSLLPYKYVNPEDWQTFRQFQIIQHSYTVNLLEETRITYTDPPHIIFPPCLWTLVCFKNLKHDCCVIPKLIIIGLSLSSESNHKTEHIIGCSLETYATKSNPT